MASPRPRLRLFCFPHAGGGASLYRDWGAHLPACVEVCPVQLPGRESRSSEPPRADVATLVSEIADAITPTLDIPFGFFGYSMGSVLGFEVARELRRRGAPSPAHLFFAAHRGPRIPPRGPFIHALPNDAFVEGLARLNGMPEEILNDAGVLAFFLPLLRADTTICECYRFTNESALPCAFTVYGGTRDPDVTRSDLDAWAFETASGCTIRMFEGDHFFVNTHRSALLDALHSDLARVVEALS